MSQTTREVIRVGFSRARIVDVSHTRIAYIDMVGQERFVDLEECARNWVQWHHDHHREWIPVGGVTQPSIDVWNAHCVGVRGADNPPWVEFMNERKTCFEFATNEALHEELLGPIRVFGWHTFDTN